MSLKELNSWLSLLANVGVVAGIVFLAVEIRQNQTAIEESNRINLVEARRSEIDQFNEHRALLIQNDNPRIWLEGLAGEDLVPSDQLIFSHLCGALTWISVGVYERSIALGRFDVAQATASKRAKQVRKYPGYRACWESTKSSIREYGIGEFVDLVDALSGVDTVNE